MAELQPQSTCPKQVAPFTIACLLLIASIGKSFAAAPVTGWYVSSCGNVNINAAVFADPSPGCLARDKNWAPTREESLARFSDCVVSPYEPYPTHPYIYTKNPPAYATGANTNRLDYLTYIKSTGSTISNFAYLMPATLELARCSDNSQPNTSKPLAEQCPDETTACPQGLAHDPVSGLCVANKNLGRPPCPAGAGNPINTTIGNKYLLQKDIEARLSGLGAWERHYNGQWSYASDVGIGWTRSFGQRLLPNFASAPTRVIAIRPSGRSYEFINDNGIGVWQSDADIRDQLEHTSTGWQLTTEDNQIEDYDANGRLLSITDLAGNTQTLSYDSNDRLDRVDANTGEYLQFGYDTSDRIATITDSASRTWTYHYDTVGNLASVDNPDGTTKQYHYNESIHTSGADLPHALTGVTDERGNRYATFEYQADGRAVASLHAGDAQRVDISYNGTSGMRTVTDSLGHTSTYSTAVQLGVALVTGIEGPGCSSCGGSNTTYSYDPANNNLLSKTANGVETQYGDYDAKGQKGYRIEAVGTTNERRTDYTYDPRFYRKMTSITEPSVNPAGQ